MTDYAGDVTPQQAYDLASADPQVVVVDVRTAAEWDYVGAPDLSAAKGRLLSIEWNQAGGVRNESFLDQLAEQGVSQDDQVLFLCRSGARSQAAAAAATRAGYAAAYNISDGFEGGVDTAGHRGSLSGWKADGLPWTQT